MFRVARNIALLLILCFIASGIPLYADTPNVNLSIGTISKNNNNNIALDVEASQVTGSNWDLSIILSTNGKAVPITFNPNQPFSIDLYHEDLHIKKLAIDEVADELPDFTTELLLEDSLTFNFNLSQEKLNLPDGDYRIAIQPIIKEIEELIPPHNVAFSFETDYDYIPAIRSINRNETALVLYFPDHELNNLIPITRVIPYTKTPLRATIDNLEMGPIMELGLPMNSPIPKTSSLRLTRGIAEVYLPNDIGLYETYASNGIIALNSFVNSLTSINEVNGVQFYFGGRIREVGFHEMYVKEPFYSPNNPSIYVGTITETDRILLTPIDVMEEDATIDFIFKQLKYRDNMKWYSYGLQPPVPTEVELLSHTLKEGILTLEFNNSFLEVYPNNDHKRAFMLEALLYSYTSLDHVESVIFQVNGQPITSYGGLQLQNPVKPSKYINPEK